jgi:predicted nuclease of predicted toxin-antitoxin system
VRRLGLENVSDQMIWDYAKENNYAIIIFDNDFIDLATLNGYPPKIIWLRTGNMTTDNIAKVLISHFENIRIFLKDQQYEDIACLETG